MSQTFYNVSYRLKYLEVKIGLKCYNAEHTRPSPSTIYLSQHILKLKKNK